MDPYSTYNKQLEHYEYVQKQKDNSIDLTSQQNDSVKTLAEMLFNKRVQNLENNLSGLILDQSMCQDDLFCMLTELFLYGFDILKGGSDIFSMNNPVEEIEIVRPYLKSCGFDINVLEDFSSESVNLYRDRSDYFYQIVKKPPPSLCFHGWYVLGYRLIENRKYIFNNNIPFESLKSFFISKDKKIYTINFRIVKQNIF